MGSFNNAFSNDFNVFVFEITTENITNPELTIPYTFQLESSANPYSVWSLNSGALPDGLVLSSDGVISGTATSLGSFNFSVEAVYDVHSEIKNYTMVVTYEFVESTGNSFVGKNGKILCPEYQAIRIFNIHNHLLDINDTNVNVVLSGEIGTMYTFNATIPVVGEFQFQYGEDIYVTTSGDNLDVCSINYIKVGDQTRFHEMDEKHYSQLAKGNNWKTEE